jgi:hypothetical protein
VSTQYNFIAGNPLPWVVTISTGLLASIWIAYDIRNLIKLRGADMSDPLQRDKRFGFVMGVLIGCVGVFGVVKYHFL